MALRKKKKTISTNLALSIWLFPIFFWYGIEASLMPRMTFGKAPCGKTGTACRPKPLDRG
jgi:hypothetical protein